MAENVTEYFFHAVGVIANISIWGTEKTRLKILD